MLSPSLSSNLNRIQWQTPLLLLLSFPLPRLLSLNRPSSLSLPTSSLTTRFGPPGLRCLSTRLRRKRNKTKSETAPQKETSNKEYGDNGNKPLVQPTVGSWDDFFRSLDILAKAHRQLLKAHQRARPTLLFRHRYPRPTRIIRRKKEESEEQREESEKARYEKLIKRSGNKLLSLNIQVKMPAPKRKMEPETKYYAVRAGVKPGVYTEWAQCQQQITGFKGAQFKSFTNYEDASAFAAGRPVASATSKTGPAKFYGVAVGRTPGVYTEWSVAQQEIVGWKNPKYRKFETRKEAEDFVRQWSGKPAALPASQATRGGATVPQVDENEDDMVEVISIGPAKSSSRKARKTGATQTAHEAQEVLDASKPVIIYTDGSARGNGKVGAMAGVGVYFCGGFRE